MTTPGLWLTSDIAGILAGLALSAESSPASEHRAGFLAALRAVAVSVGAEITTGQPLVIDVRPARQLTGYEDLGPFASMTFR